MPRAARAVDPQVLPEDPEAPIAALVKKLPPLDQDFLRTAATVPDDRKGRYSTADKYYDGDHGVALTDRLTQFLEASGLKYNENFCETIVDALAERLRVAGVSTSMATHDPADDTEHDVFASFVWDVLWDRNRMDAKQGTIHTEVLKKGDGFLIVDFDKDKGFPTIVFNGPERCQIEYEDGVAVWAAKTWDTRVRHPLNPSGRAITRMNLFFPDRIEKYLRLSVDAGTWYHWTDEDDPSWPVDWTYGSGEGRKPLGIPVFHLANKAGTKKYGRAEHWGTIPQQDGLNKDLIDLSGVSDTMGFPQRYIAGDSGTNELKTQPGTVWRSPNAATVFGQFPAAELSGILASAEARLMRIAARSRTPAHMIILSGGAPSGESLKTAEAGLVAKAKDRASIWGEEYIGCFRMLAILAALYGNGELKPTLTVEQITSATINVNWTDPTSRNEEEHLRTLLLMKDVGVSDETLLSRIDGIDAHEERHRKQQNINTAGAALLAAMDNPAAVAPERPLVPRPLAGAAAQTAEAFGRPPIGNLPG